MEEDVYRGHLRDGLVPLPPLLRGFLHRLLPHTGPPRCAFNYSTRYGLRNFIRA